MNNTKVDFLVLGATGMQGSIVTRHLSKGGYHVFISGRNQSRLGEILQKYKIDLENTTNTDEILEGVNQRGDQYL